MFTGIIKTIGKIISIKEIDTDIQLTIEYDGTFNADLGDSICVNGACLTIINLTHNTLDFYLSQETLSKVVPFYLNQEVNLEESLKIGDKVGGHFVFGHIDSKAILKDVKKASDSQIWVMEIPSQFQKFIAPKGSVAINGVSLTVNGVDKNNFSLNLIPHTIENTTFKTNKINDQFNFEIDMLARYALNG